MLCFRGDTVYIQLLNTNASLFWIIMDVYMIAENYIILFTFCHSGYSYNKKLPLNSTRNFQVEGFELCKPLKLTSLMKM